MNVDHPSRRPKSDILALISLHKKEVSLVSLTAFVLLVACINSYLTNTEESEIVSSTRLASLDDTKAVKSNGGNSLLEITLGEVTYRGSKTLSYYHCGPLPLPGSLENEHLTELVLLHGAAFTKENWRESGILQSLCDVNEGTGVAEGQSTRTLSESIPGHRYPRPLSVTALDLPVPGEGDVFYDAIQSLASQQNNVLSGNPIVVVTPSAGGRAIVSLGEIMASSTAASEDEQQQQQQQQQTPSLLEKAVKAWIPVASGAVMRTTDEVLELFPKLGIEILAINGNLDFGGRRATERLVEVCGAKGVELEGAHPVYLDSPEEFVDEVLKFLIEKEL
ncbi:hypothetical protein ACHAXS_002643 [Conticribra weissflogii]